MANENPIMHCNNRASPSLFSQQTRHAHHAQAHINAAMFHFYSQSTTGRCVSVVLLHLQRVSGGPGGEQQSVRVPQVPKKHISYLLLPGQRFACNVIHNRFPETGTSLFQHKRGLRTK